MQTVSDFRRYTEFHQERVRILAHEALRRYPERFSHVSAELLNRYLALHDRNKLAPTFLEPLFSLYGQSVSQMSEAEQKRARTLIESFNAADAKDVSDFFERNPESRGAKEQLEKLEKIADLVDRGSSPLSSEEFGRAMQPASRFFQSPEPRDLQLLQELERDYAALTRGRHLSVPKLPCVTKALRFDH